MNENPENWHWGLVTLILFELCLLWYLAQSQILVTTLYLLQFSAFLIVIFCFVAEPCCALKYYPEIEICVKEQKGEQEAKRKEAQRLEDENFGNHIIGRVRTFLWNLFEYPETSKAAQVCYYYYNQN